eukprot:4255344-Amphidinium_carterae.1
MAAAIAACASRGSGDGNLPALYLGEAGNGAAYPMGMPSVAAMQTISGRTSCCTSMLSHSWHPGCSSTLGCKSLAAIPFRDGRHHHHSGGGSRGPGCQACPG